jgi:hypothetical protein
MPSIISLITLRTLQNSCDQLETISNQLETMELRRIMGDRAYDEMMYKKAIKEKQYDIQFNKVMIKFWLFILGCVGFVAFVAVYSIYYN